MADRWDIAKHVMLWKSLPPGSDGKGADGRMTLLARVADALRAEDFIAVERLCRRALAEPGDGFIPSAFLASRLLTDPTRADEAAELILACGPQDHPERRAMAAALLASAAAHRARRAVSVRHAADALAALEDVDDELFSAYVEARLAEAATWRGDALETQTLAERATRRFERHGRDGMAAATMTMLFLPLFDSGDLAAVQDLIETGDAYARRAESRNLQRTFATIRVILGATIGDEAMLQVSTRQLETLTAHDNFVALVYAAMPHGWHGRWHEFLTMVRTAEPVTTAHQALVDAMIALGAAATRDDNETRSRWRRAVHRLASGGVWNNSDTRIRDLARAVACVAGVAVGDVARAERAALPLRGTREESIFTDVPEPLCAGFQRLVSAMRERRKSTEPAVALTPAQTAILRLLATDASIADIARGDPERRSVATIRSHVQCVYEALEVHSRTGAVLKAKELQLL